ncbi:MAG: AAA family ATPase [Massilia sp.]
MIQALPGYTIAHTVREDTHFVLVRATCDADGVPVLVLRARLPEAHARLEHEYALRADLDPAWAAKPLALLRHGAELALVLSDSGAMPLACLPGQPLALGPFLRLAIAIGLSLTQLHRHDIVHKDLRPEHLLVDAAGSAVRLTGFGGAARLRSLPPVPEVQLSGSLAYMAPEQTGRMNRAIDTRTDLYSLGVLLYQLLCGALPFTGGDAMQWIHCHVAREPLAPHQHFADADPTCAAIILKLLAKSAEQRYQTAAGLVADLQHCLAQFEAHGHIDPFVLACNDGAARLQIPEALIGRTAQMGLLEEAALHVAAGGAPELVMISGNAGTGKSALLAALQLSDAVAGAIVVSARFEQHTRDIPYATLAQAFQKLVRQMLGQSEASLANWRRALLAALGPNAGLMLDLIPELKFVIGEPSAPVPLAPVEAQARFNAVFRQFLGAFTGADSMLLLCLDDLQWVDAASLKLLTHLVTHADVRHVLVVGAFRSSEVNAAHPLALTREVMRRQGAGVRQVVLQALNRSDAGALVAAALDCPAPQCAGLADLVYAKTAGNPFFTLQFLTRLVESGLLRYGHAQEAWSWDGPSISAKEFSDNVVDLMIARLQQLPYNTLELVKLLACLGHDASLATLGQVAGMSSVETDECLWPAARLGLVMREPGAYRFMHDRVQEAAYSMIARASLPERHLHIGRQLLDQLPPTAPEQQLFGAVSHLNRAQDAIADPAELRALARLNARAGTRARAAVAYDAARHYFSLAAGLTPASAWQDDFEATFALYCGLAECEYLCGNLERANQLYGTLAEHARSRLEVAQVALMRTALYQVWGRFDLAAAVALDALVLFGVSFPEGEREVADALAAEQAAVARNMAGRTIAALEDEPVSADPEICVVMELLSDMGSSVFSARPLIYPLLAVKSLNFTLRFGSTPTSCMTYTRYAILLVSLGAIPDAFAFSELALRMARQSGASIRRSGRLSFVHGAYVHSWRQPIVDSVALLEQSFQTCQEAGDLPHAGYSAHIATWNSYEAGAPLAEVQQRARGYQRFARQQHNEVLMQLLRCYEQLTLCLQGATGAEGSFDDHRFSASAALAAMDKASFGAARARFHLMRQIAAFSFGQYDEALLAAEAAARDQHFFLASVNESTHHFYHALTLTALYPTMARESQAAAMVALQEKLDKLRVWAAHCPGNFDNRLLLVTAELARIGGRDMEAMRAYDAAIASAHQGGFVHHEALAAELAAGFYRERGFEKIALAYARDALQACARWGAYGKMRELERRYAGLARVPSPDAGAGAAPSEALDLMVVLHAAQDLAGATERKSLCESLLRVALEQGAAARALLMLPAPGGWRCAGRAISQGSAVEVETRDMALAVAGVPESLLQFVLRTRESVVLDDALASVQFRDDPYVQRARPRSVLCMPLLRHGSVNGVLYLDHGLAPGLFTSLRVVLLELVAAQAAIALAQTTMLGALREDNDAQRHALEASRRKAAFLAGLEDALRAPLEAIADASADGGPSAAMTQIRRAVQELSPIVNDVLDFARIEAGAMRLACAPFSLTELSHDACAAALQRHGMQLQLALGAGLPDRLLGDAARLTQVVGSLAEFAHGAAQGAPVVLAIALEGVDGDVANLRFSMSCAAGALAQQGEAQFHPFRNAQPSRARGTSGLGLAIAQDLVRRMGGLIECSSVPGGGTQLHFRLNLPCAGAAAAHGASIRTQLAPAQD